MYSVTVTLNYRDGTCYDQTHFDLTLEGLHELIDGYLKEANASSVEFYVSTKPQAQFTRREP
jgi:hypothetical protein